MTGLSQPAATPYGFADPVAQRRIVQLEAAIGDLYKARDEAEMERDELRGGEVLVEDSWFKRSDLPTILGNFMRSSADYAREAKAMHIERDELRAKVAQVEALAEDAAAQDRSEVAPVYGIALLIRQALTVPLPPSEPSVLPEGPGTAHESTGGAE